MFSDRPLFLILLLTNGLALSLVVATLGDELDTTAAHDAGSEHVAVELLLRRELQDVEGVLGVLQLLVVVDRLDLDLALRDVDVVEGISRDGAPEKIMLLSIKRIFVIITLPSDHPRRFHHHSSESFSLINMKCDTYKCAHLHKQISMRDNRIFHHLLELVEDMVAPLNSLLLRDTGLLKQVGHDVTTGKLSGSGEVDTDELSEPGGVVVPRGLRVAVRLQNWVGGNDLVLKGDFLGFLLCASSTSRHHRKVGDHL